MESTSGTPPGDPRQGEAWLDQLYRDNWKPLIDALLSRCHVTQVDAEEIAHDVFEHLSQKLKEGTLPQIRKPMGFLWRTAKRRLINRVESGHHQESLEQVLEEPRIAGISRPEEMLLGRSPGPKSLLLSAEDHALTAQAMAELPDRDRAMIEMHFSGRTYPEIASDFEITTDNAEKIVERALAKIKRSVGRYHSSILEGGPKPTTQKAAKEAIKGLPKDYGVPLWDFYVLARSREGIARKLGLSLETVAERLRRGEELLSLRYGLKMPDELVSALANTERR